MTDRDIVIWVDPGQTTGIASWSFTVPGTPPFVAEMNFATTGALLEEMSRMYAGRRVSIGWEAFTITVQTAKNTPAPWSLEVIGVCRHIALREGWEILPEQKPADRDLAKVSYVDRLGWCPRGKRDDGMSAVRHLLRWLIVTRLAPQPVWDMIVTDGE